MPKLLVLDNFGSFSLVPYLKKKWNGEVISMGNIYDDKMWWIFKRVDPDVVFVDFCEKNAVVLTDRIRELSKKPKVVIRLHGYEAFGSYLSAVNWDFVSNLIVVSPMYERIVRRNMPNSKVNIQVVFNGLDIEKFQLQDNDGIDDDAIAYISYLNRKKGIALLRTIIASTPNKKFHVGGPYQEEPVRLYLQDLDLKNVRYYGQVQTEKFLVGKRYIMSTSVSESFGMTIAEGMAMGDRKSVV